MIPANDFIAKLRMEPDNVLKQMADMHQNDPYLFPMIFQEAQARKDMRAQAQAKQQGQATPTTKEQDLQQIAALDQPQQPPQMGQPAPPAGSMPQAPNTPSGMPLQGPGSGAQMLPEQQGIGALPAPNLQGIGHAAGGIMGYAAGGLDSYAPQIFAEAKRLGIDPNIAFNLFKTESEGNKNATSSKGAAGLGQLMKPAAQEMGLSDEERYDPQKNISASLGYFKKQLDRFGSYDKAAAAYNWGPGHLKEHLKKNDGVLNINGLPKETASYLTKLMPGSQANAAEIPQAAAPTQTTAPAQAPVSSASMIPGQSVQAPAYIPQQKGFFGNLADKLGISEDTQNNISNLSNAAAGATGAAFIPSYLPKVGMGIAGLGERLYNKFAPEAGAVSQKAISELQTANKAGQVEQGVRGAQEAGSTLEEQDYLRKMMEANQQAQVPSKALELQNASNVRQATEAARMLEGANAARAAAAGTAGVADLSSAAAQPSASTLAGANTAAQTQDMEDMEDPGFGALQKLQGTPTAPSPSDIANTVTQTAGGKGGRDWNDFLLNLGLGMMAGKSPYAFQNLGEAGIGALKQEQESRLQGLKERQVAAEERKAASEEAYQKALGAHYGVTPEIQLVQAMKDPEFAKQYQSLVSAKAAPATTKELIDSYMKTLNGKTGDFSGFQDFVQQMSQYTGTMPSGVKVTKRGD